jgi:hypothetical protein
MPCNNTRSRQTAGDASNRGDGGVAAVGWRRWGGGGGMAGLTIEASRLFAGLRLDVRVRAGVLKIIYEGSSCRAARSAPKSPKDDDGNAGRWLLRLRYYFARVRFAQARLSGLKAGLTSLPY